MAVLVGGVLLSACSSGSGIPGGESLSAFSASMRHQVESRFQVSGIHTTSCVTPHSWRPGSQFTCYFYRSNGSQIGRLVGTVLNGGSANISWHPAG